MADVIKYVGSITEIPKGVFQIYVQKKLLMVHSVEHTNNFLSCIRLLKKLNSLLSFLYSTIQRNISFTDKHIHL